MTISCQLFSVTGASGQRTGWFLPRVMRNENCTFLPCQNCLPIFLSPTLFFLSGSTIVANLPILRRQLAILHFYVWFSRWPKMHHWIRCNLSASAPNLMATMPWRRTTTIKGKQLRLRDCPSTAWWIAILALILPEKLVSLSYSCRKKFL